MKSVVPFGLLLLLLAAPLVNAAGLAVNFTGLAKPHPDLPDPLPGEPPNPPNLAVPRNVAPEKGFGWRSQANWNNVGGETVEPVVFPKPGPMGEILEFTSTKITGIQRALVDAAGQRTQVSVGWTASRVDTALAGNGTWPGALPTDPAACTGCQGLQDGGLDVLAGNIRAKNSFGETGQQIEITLTGVNRLLKNYDVFVYFSSTPDQGDQYRVEFNDGIQTVVKLPVTIFPLNESQGGGGGRSIGDWRGFDDNNTLIGQSGAYGARQNDSVAVSSFRPGVPGLPGLLTGDTLVITVQDTNNNSNNWDKPFGQLNGMGGPNWGSNADVGVAGIQLIGQAATTDQCDLNGDGRIDGADVGILYGHWNFAGGLGDCNLDGIVDGADLGTVYSRWTGDAVGYSVPEPVVPSMVVCGCFVYLARRRRSRTSTNARFNMHGN